MDKKISVVTNLLWRFLERCGAQLVGFVVSVVLARLLEPSLYGTVALITAITTILQVFVDSGMGSALIQKKDSDDLDFSSVFYFNLVFCLVLYAGLFIAAPLLARAYHDLSLTPLIRVLGLVVVVSGVKNVQQAYVSKTLQFRRFFFATLGGTLFSAVLGIVLAYLGAGVWALVAQQLSNAAVNTAILWLTVGWKPKREFSFQRLGALISYGWKILVSALMDTLYLKGYQLIIGLRYSEADLAFFNRADQLPNLVVDNVNASIDSVLLPVLSGAQDDPAQVREMTRRAIKTSTYIMLPLMVGLAVCARPVIRLLLTEKWLPCVPYLQILCLVYAFWPVHTANLQAINAQGRSDLFLKLEILKKISGLLFLLLALPYGIIFMLILKTVNEFVCAFINAFSNKKLLDYGFGRQLIDMLPSFLCSLIMGAAVYAVSFTSLTGIALLAVQILTGIVTYIIMSLLMNRKLISELFSMIKPVLARSDKS